MIMSLAVANICALLSQCSVETDTMTLTYTVRPPPSLTVLLPLLGPASFGVWMQLPHPTTNESSLEEERWTIERSWLSLISGLCSVLRHCECEIANSMSHFNKRGFGGPKVGGPAQQALGPAQPMDHPASAGVVHHKSRISFISMIFSTYFQSISPFKLIYFYFLYVY